MMSQPSRRWLIALFSFVVAVTAWPRASADNPEHVAQFRQTRACRGCDLSNANLAGIQAPRADLTDANLRDATFYGGDLRETDFTGAILDGANLEMVNLAGAVGAVLGEARTDARTTCPDGTPGPCQ
jgi:Pentapeptide repeats (8 copies)